MEPLLEQDSESAFRIPGKNRPFLFYLKSASFPYHFYHIKNALRSLPTASLTIRGEICSMARLVAAGILLPWPSPNRLPGRCAPRRLAADTRVRCAHVQLKIRLTVRYRKAGLHQSLPKTHILLCNLHKNGYFSDMTLTAFRLCMV